jgi:hypothetical protein
MIFDRESLREAVQKGLSSKLFDSYSEGRVFAALEASQDPVEAFYSLDDETDRSLLLDLMTDEAYAPFRATTINLYWQLAKTWPGVFNK